MAGKIVMDCPDLPEVPSQGVGKVLNERDLGGLRHAGASLVAARA